MKKIGIIAEYNPFHNGHLYQIQKAKSDLNPDLIIVVMSQDVTQRGEFTSFDKWWRTQKALEAGADLVIGLPYCVSSQSAEYFAQGALNLLNELGIDTLVFGSENANLELLQESSQTLIENEEEITSLIKKNLKEGFSYPKSREMALKTYGINNPDLYKPNNILGLEYLKAIYKNNFNIKPYLIKREGAGYHDNNLNNSFASASGIRKALEKKEAIQNQTPYPETELINHFKSFDETSFFKSILVKLINSSQNELENIVGINSDRANQLINLKGKVFNLEDLFKELKSKNITQTALNRMILNLMMDFKKNDFKIFNSKDYIPYLRVLGFNKKGQNALKNLKIPVITTFNKGIRKLNEQQMKSIEYDLKAAQLRSIFLDLTEYNKDYFNKIVIK